MKKSIRLSKSKIITGLQCEKALYLSEHHFDLAEEVSDSQQRIFDQGHEVGIHAQSYYPEGILIDAPYTDPDLAIKQTSDAIQSGTLTIYEATFRHEGVLVKVDILTRQSVKQAWQIIEVKSSTKVNDVYLNDAAIQLWVTRASGLKVKSVSIITINNQCTYPDLSNLFNLRDVTKEAEKIMAGVPKTVTAFKTMLAKKNPPKKEIGPHCSDPYGCSFQEHCWTKHKIPEVSIFDIPRLSSEKKWELFYEGIINLADLDSSEFNATQKRMIDHTVANTRYINQKGITEELKEWTYPLSYLDFETIGFAIPKHDGQKPYQQLPFQFSCHIQHKPNSKIEHCEYIHTKDSDPREQLSAALVKMVPKTGSVIAYNKGFEGGVLKTLAALYPKYQKALLSIAERLVDPMPIFRAHVYDPRFKGSFSIKEVAPALLGNDASYDSMTVGDGSAAQTAYLEMINPSITPKQKEKLRKALIDYCTKDTMGMVKLVEWLFEEGLK